MANNMNKKKLWSDSLTRDSLTTYAEGLACDNFDRGKTYHIRRIDQNSWYVLKHCAGKSKFDSRESGALLYDRVRHVGIDSDGFMSCSCGKVQMYLMPCQHICAIIAEKKYYVPSMFHIRWHKMFNYYHGNSFGNGLATHSTRTIDNIVSWTKANCYRQSGSYKGVYVENSDFFTELLDFNLLKTNDDILVSNLMNKIISETNRGHPVLKDSIPLNVLEEMNAVTQYDDIDSTMDMKIDEMDNMGGSSQVECYLSQHREEIDDNIDILGSHRNTYYRDALPLFEEMVNSCPNDYLFKEMCTILRNRHMVHVASRGVNNQLLPSNGSALFGENNTNRRTVKRHKFTHEKK